MMPTSAAAVPAGVFACYMNSGQTCSALTRMLVPRDKLAEVEELAAGAAAGFAPGDPFEPGKLLGPLVSGVQRERVRGYINKGIEEGAKLVIGGADAPEGLEKGFFVQPTVFSDVTPDMTIAREEIFGPVLSIIPYDTEEEAIEIANGTPYGLSGGVWSGDPARAEKVARADANRAGRYQRREPSTRARPSAGTSSRASGASGASTASRSSSRRRRCSARTTPPRSLRPGPCIACPRAESGPAGPS